MIPQGSPFKCGGQSQQIIVKNSLTLRVDQTANAQVNVKLYNGVASATTAEYVLFAGDALQLDEDQLRGSQFITVINIGSPDPNIFWGP